MFPGAAIRTASVVFKQLRDVRAEADMRHNCSAVMTAHQVWELPSLLMLDFEHARFAA